MSSGYTVDSPVVLERRLLLHVHWMQKAKDEAIPSSSPAWVTALTLCLLICMVIMTPTPTQPHRHGGTACKRAPRLRTITGRYPLPSFSASWRADLVLKPPEPLSWGCRLCSLADLSSELPPPHLCPGASSAGKQEVSHLKGGRQGCLAGLCALWAPREARVGRWGALLVGALGQEPVSHFVPSSEPHTVPPCQHPGPLVGALLLKVLGRK